MSIRFEVDGDRTNLIATVSGRLRLADHVALRDNLLKCLAEQPGALLVDLSGLEVRQPPALSALTAVLAQAARWPGTPVLLCGATPATRALLAGGVHHHRLRLCDGLTAALDLLRDHRGAMPSLSEELLPVAGSTRHARDIATDICLRWDLPGLVAPASLIANELVANVVDHAHTMMTLRLSLRQRHLDIAVRDGSPRMPSGPARVSVDATGGRGLLLVGEMAHHWGCLPSKDGGKVVWAALRR
jgi:anti-anti-sigma regulatory factor